MYNWSYVSGTELLKTLEGLVMKMIEMYFVMLMRFWKEWGLVNKGTNLIIRELKFQSHTPFFQKGERGWRRSSVTNDQ